MKVYCYLFAILVGVAFPLITMGQQYGVTQNHANRYVNIPGNYVQNQAAVNGLGQPIPQPMPAQPMSTAPAMTNFCDAGGCDMGGSVYSGCGVDASGGLLGGSAACDSNGFGVDCGMGCDSGCCKGGGTYFAIFGGSSEMDPQTSTGYQRDVQIGYDQGYAIGAALGRRIGRNLRTELEYVFRSQTPDTVNFNGNNIGNVSGFQNSHAGMLNVVYDLVLGKGTIVPYLGGGIGVASIDSNVRYGTGVATLDGDDSSVAYQWMVGLSFRARPNMEFFTEYRFFEIDDPKLNRMGGPALGSSPNPNVLLNSEYISNDIFAGLRFNY